MAKPDLCPVCHEITQIDAVTLRENYPLKKGTVKIGAQVYRCEECGGTFSDAKQEEFNYELAVEVFRREKNLLSPEEIKSIREKYGLSQRQFSALLGWSPATLSSYENNKIQERSHNDVLLFLHSPRNMMRLLEVQRKNMDAKVAAKLEKHVEELIVEERQQLEIHQLNSHYEEIPVGIMTGNRSFVLRYFVQAAVYMLKRSGPEFKTKFLKLLFYADFLSFKRYDNSITGTVYAHLPHGPVPDRFQTLVDFMERKGYLTISVQQFDDCEGEILSAKATTDTDCFSKEELNVMDNVVDKFKDFKSWQMREYSHKEAAYTRTESTEKISYEFAKELSLD